MDTRVVAVILAGGVGKRMESNLPKVLHTIGGVPMIVRILHTLKQLETTVHLEKVILVVGDAWKEIQAAVEQEITMPNLVYVRQPTPLGTGHAVMCCERELLQHPHANVLILSGDVPLLRAETLKSLLDCPSDAKFIAAKVENPSGYGRVICKENVFEKIVEHKDCSEEERKISKINAGIYCITSKLLCKYFPYLNNNNAQGEYYLTDMIEIIKREEAFEIDMFDMQPDRLFEIMGVNTVIQRDELEKILAEKKGYV